ncbi:hypothetical protein FA09DRAFT_179002 [Tilletiopsis washingtonensis]|uniref:Uncharacterized protein n=1 Tax=Tilletiopsis washingtonensis TaxID=58919 RepID=A0A316Z339_9BASI|nr:hypothetical protein FA09DRAFT_179002 [Tilletiopsis washingtonensis]PWN94585.1 hypothetical protein FA09DRAFT_179002 [Tilletiopsis washingtonensis]
MHAGQGCSRGGAASGAACSEAARAHAAASCAASEQRSDGACTELGSHSRGGESAMSCAASALRAYARAHSSRSASAKQLGSDVGQENALLRVPLTRVAAARASRLEAVWLMGWCLRGSDGYTPRGQERSGARGEVSRHGMNACLRAAAHAAGRPSLSGRRLVSGHHSGPEERLPALARAKCQADAA